VIEERDFSAPKNPDNTVTGNFFTNTSVILLKTTLCYNITFVIINVAQNNKA
jgi:hypothetical protein